MSIQRPPPPPLPQADLRRAPVRISCPLDMNISVSMPPINKRIDPMFDCLDNLCESQPNSSQSGFKDAHAGAVSYLRACFSQLWGEASRPGSSRISAQMLHDPNTPSCNLTLRQVRRGSLARLLRVRRCLNCMKDARLQKRKVNKEESRSHFLVYKGKQQKCCRCCQKLQQKWAGFDTSNVHSRQSCRFTGG